MTKFNLIGQKFNRWTVIDEAPQSVKRDSRWLCRCDCGTEKIIIQYSLRSGTSKSCGCYSAELSKERFSKFEKILTKEFLEKEYVGNRKSTREIAKIIGCTSKCVWNHLRQHNINQRSRRYDIIGKQFGKLVVLSMSPNHNYRSRASRWICKCDCGNEKEISGQKLITHRVKSCGCLARTSSNFSGHGSLSGKYWGHTQKGARERNLEFSITIKQAWDMFQKQNGKCALSGLPIEIKRCSVHTASLDRIDSSAGYTLDNIQWVHKDVQKLKNNFPEERLFFLCEKITSHMQKC